MRDLRLLYRYLLKVVLPPFIISLLLFTFFVETLDIVVNLIRYLDRDVSLYNIILLQWLFLPTSVSYALPVAILFSVTFSIGQLYANNELIAIFSSGISLFRFVLPLILLGALLGVGNFYFKENVVIRTFRAKNELSRVLLNQQISESSSQVAILQEGGEIVYYADYYDDTKQSLHNVIIVITDVDNTLDMRINANTGLWNGTEWVFEGVRIYRYKSELQEYFVEQHNTYIDPRINALPSNFKRIINNIDEMTFFAALEYIKQLKARGHSYHKLLTDTYARVPLSLSPFIVMIVACISGSVFRRNIMLMSLLNALVTAVVYYSSDLIGSILAARGLVPPLIGAWIGFFITIIMSGIIYRYFIK